MQTSGRWRIDSSHSSTFHVEFHLFRVYVRVVAVPFDNEISAGVQVGALKTREWKTLEWKTRYQTAGVENAGVENAAPDGRGGKVWKAKIPRYLTLLQVCYNSH